MSNMTPLDAQNNLNSITHGKKEEASAIKAAHAEARKTIQSDLTLSPIGQREKLDALAAATKTALGNLKQRQDDAVKGLRDTLEKQLRGSQPADASSVLLRRDARDRARKISDQREALEVLEDAVANGDVEMANAVGIRARNHGWIAAAEAWKAAYPETAGSAEALSYVESSISSGAFNLANGITFSAPQD